MVRKKNKTSWTVYILECANKSLYTGITNNLEKRIRDHNSRKGAKYTRAFGPVKLVWKRKQKTKSAALKKESEIKSWPRQKKWALVKKT